MGDEVIVIPGDDSSAKDTSVALVTGAAMATAEAASESAAQAEQVATAALVAATSAPDLTRELEAITLWRIEVDSQIAGLRDEVNGWGGVIEAAISDIEGDGALDVVPVTEEPEIPAGPEPESTVESKGEHAEGHKETSSKRRYGFR